MSDTPIRSQSALELLETHAKALEEQNVLLRAALEMINMLACYASEENTDSREAVLLQIGKLARGEVSPAVPERAAHETEPPL